MNGLTAGKRASLEKLTNEQGIIGALAIDQRGALKRMIAEYKNGEAVETDIVNFKKIVSKELTPFASSILLDPEYGLPAAAVRSETTGLLLAYEKTGYDASTPGRLPDSLDQWSVKRLKAAGADACKFLLYYDVDEGAEVNEQKQVYIERIGSECVAEDIPFFLELVSYDAQNPDTSSVDYAKQKPHKVIDMMKEFSKPAYKVDVLKVEVPVNMNYVQGLGEKEIVYTKAEAAAYYKQQSEATDLPFIFLSGGVSAELFQKTLLFANESGSTFNGVLCGRATWANGVDPFINIGETAAIDWMNKVGKSNIEELNAVLARTAASVFEKVK